MDMVDRENNWLLTLMNLLVLKRTNFWLEFFIVDLPQSLFSYLPTMVALT